MNLFKNYKWSTITGLIAAGSLVALIILSMNGLSDDWTLIAGVIAIASLAAFLVLLFEELEYDPWADFYSQSSWTNIRDNDLAWNKFEGDEGLKEEVKHPSHYNAYSVELIEVTSQMPFCLGNAVKYVVRDGLKSGATKDLEKAIRYLELDETYPATQDFGDLTDSSSPGYDVGFTEKVERIFMDVYCDGRENHAYAFWYLCTGRPGLAEGKILEAMEECDNVH